MGMEDQRTDTSEGSAEAITKTDNLNLSALGDHATLDLCMSHSYSAERHAKSVIVRTRPVATVPRPEIEKTSRGVGMGFGVTCNSHPGTNYLRHA